MKGALLRAVDKLDVALAESRAALKGLHRSAPNDNDLARQLSEAASDTPLSGVTLKMTITGEPRALRPVVHYEAFRIGCEAIGNALRHSGASSLQVDLDYMNGFRIVVRDDGKGIPEDVLHAGRDGHFGLLGMQKRADRIGASLRVYNRAGAGTEVRLEIPGHIAFLEALPTSSLIERILFRIKSARFKPPD